MAFLDILCARTYLYEHPIGDMFTMFYFFKRDLNALKSSLGIKPGDNIIL